MSRIRTIKPSFFRSEDVSALPMRARLTWIGLWTHCDDQGRAKDNVRLIKADVWPLDQVSLAEIEEDLSTLADQGRIARYEVDGKRYLEIANWSDHQKIDRPTKSTIPAPSTNSHRNLDESSTSPRDGKGREGEGKGGEANREASANPQAVDNSSPEPPSRCSEHLKTKNPPSCGPCKDARVAHERWTAERRSRIASAAKCATHPDQLASNCAACRSERIAR